MKYLIKPMVCGKGIMNYSCLYWLLWVWSGGTWDPERLLLLNTKQSTLKTCTQVTLHRQH